MAAYGPVAAMAVVTLADLDQTSEIHPDRFYVYLYASPGV